MNPRVLVVDDTDGNRYVVSRILRGAGMEVLEAENGARALELVRSVPDLVVLDINLPDITGYEVCRHIKSDPVTATIPVMHLSASYTASADRAFGLEAGADAYLTHPIDPPVLVATVRALLRAGQAEAELRETAAEWRTTFDAIGDAIFLVTAGGVVHRCNAAAASLVGAQPKAVVNRPWAEVAVSLVPDAPSLATITEAPVDPAARPLVVTIGARSFRVSTHRGAATSAPDPVTVVCVLTDITPQETARREREQLLERTEAARREAEAARLDAEAANQAKSQFLAVMSHELRTPLNAIGGFTDLISLGVRGPVTPEQELDLQRIRRSQTTLMGLINDLLSFAKIESGSVHYEMRPLPVSESLGVAAEYVEAQLLAKDITFTLSACDDTVMAHADGDRLQQILLNLLSNAVKFTDAGGRITLACDATDTHVRIRVSDTGHGIPSDKLDVIFDPFVQVDQLPTRRSQGVGLGLAISRDLARGMGGDLHVESEETEGSTFTLTLSRAIAIAS